MVFRHHKSHTCEPPSIEKRRMDVNISRDPCMRVFVGVNSGRPQWCNICLISYIEFDESTRREQKNNTCFFL